MWLAKVNESEHLSITRPCIEGEVNIPNGRCVDCRERGGSPRSYEEHHLLLELGWKSPHLLEKEPKNPGPISPFLLSSTYPDLGADLQLCRSRAILRRSISGPNVGPEWFLLIFLVFSLSFPFASLLGALNERTPECSTPYLVLLRGRIINCILRPSQSEPIRILAPLPGNSNCFEVPSLLSPLCFCSNLGEGLARTPCLF